MHRLFQKSHLVPLCHCLQEEKGKLKSIILTWASLIAQEFNSISSAPNRGQDLTAANEWTSQRVSSVSNEEGKPVQSVCVRWERSDVCAWGRWMLWLGALHVWGNFCEAGADRDLQGDALGTKVGMCCLIRARHAADSASSCFEEPANETSLGYLCPCPGGDYWTARYHQYQCEPRTKYHVGEGLLEGMARLRRVSGWENFINIMDMESSKDSQMKMLET